MPTSLRSVAAARLPIYNAATVETEMLPAAAAELLLHVID